MAVDLDGMSLSAKDVPELGLLQAMDELDETVDAFRAALADVDAEAARVKDAMGRLLDVRTPAGCGDDESGELEVVKLGRWRQTADGDALPLRWVVVEEEEDGGRLLVSEKVLEWMPWEGESWRSSNLRIFLTQFFEDAFDDHEKSLLRAGVVGDFDLPLGSPFCEDPTKDHVFVLGLGEYLKARAFEEPEEAIEATPWAAAHGAPLGGPCPFFLRPTAWSQYKAMVDGDDVILRDVNEPVFAGVRPAVYLAPAS